MLVLLRLDLLGLRGLDSGRPRPLSLPVSRGLSLMDLLVLLDPLCELGQLLSQVMVRVEHWVRDRFETLGRRDNGLL